MMPNSAIASALVALPSTTAEAAVTFCSNVYLACLPSMAGSTSLPNAACPPPLPRGVPGDGEGERGDAAAHARIEQLGGTPPRLDVVLHPEIDAHKKTSHFSCPRNGRQFMPRCGGFRFWRLGWEPSWLLCIPLGVRGGVGVKEDRGAQLVPHAVEARGVAALAGVAQRHDGHDLVRLRDAKLAA